MSDSSKIVSQQRENIIACILRKVLKPGKKMNLDVSEIDQEVMQGVVASLRQKGLWTHLSSGSLSVQRPPSGTPTGSGDLVKDLQHMAQKYSAGKGRFGGTGIGGELDALLVKHGFNAEEECERCGEPGVLTKRDGDGHRGAQMLCRNCLEGGGE